MTCRRALVHASAASALCLAAIAAGKYLPPKTFQTKRYW